MLGKLRVLRCKYFRVQVTLPLISRGFTKIAPSTTPPKDPPLPRELRVKRMLYRAQQRGWRELDIIVGNWAEAHIHQLSDTELDQFEALLSEEIPDLYKWLSGQAQVPKLYQNSVMNQLREFTMQGNVTGFTSATRREIVKTKRAPTAIGPYSQAVKANGFLFVSGVIGLNPETMEFPSGGIKEQTETVMSSLKAILEEGGSSVDHVVKTTVLLDDMKDYAVVNEIYGKTFHTNPPARAAFAVSTLPKNALVEIDAVALLK